jgi:hypothetical protein
MMLKDKLRMWGELDGEWFDVNMNINTNLTASHSSGLGGKYCQSIESKVEEWELFNWW